MFAARFWVYSRDEEPSRRAARGTADVRNSRRQWNWLMKRDEEEGWIKSKIFYEWIKWRSVTIKITISNHTTWIMTDEMLWPERRVKKIQKYAQRAHTQAHTMSIPGRDAAVVSQSLSAHLSLALDGRHEKSKTYKRPYEKEKILLLIVFISEINSIFFSSVSWGEPRDTGE